MRNLKIVIAGLLVMVLAGLTGCTGAPSEEGDSNEHPLIQAISNQLKVKRDTEIFALARTEGRRVTVTVTVHNVNQRPIASVQSWISYNPKQLKGVSIKTDHSPLKLTAPYENDFDHLSGLVRIGRSGSEPVTDPRVEVAEITFERLTDDLIMLSFYDYQTYLTGHTSVNMLENNIPHNILKQPKFPAAVIR